VVLCVRHGHGRHMAIMAHLAISAKVDARSRVSQRARLSLRSLAWSWQQR
jgi:hypothetical protein